jgi:hypothetical protein
VLEALLAATATSGLVVLARGNRRQNINADLRVQDSDEDLPCPWCYSQTDSNDDRCRNCGRRFG